MDSLLNTTPDQLLSAWYKARLLHDITDRVSERYFPTQQQTLTKKLQELDIVSQKRALGIPLTDDDYEDAVNEEKPFLQKNLAMMGIGGASILGGALKPLPSLKAFEKPTVMNYGAAPKLNDLGGIFKYFGQAKAQNKTKEIAGDLVNGWIRRGVFRR